MLRLDKSTLINIGSTSEYHKYSEECGIKVYLDMYDNIELIEDLVKLDFCTQMIAYDNAKNSKAIIVPEPLHTEKVLLNDKISIGIVMKTLQGKHLFGETLDYAEEQRIQFMLNDIGIDHEDLYQDNIFYIGEKIGIIDFGHENIKFNMITKACKNKVVKILPNPEEYLEYIVKNY